MPLDGSSPPIKALVDINIFEDVFRRRAGWQSSEGVIRAVRSGKVVGYVSALTVPILWFFRSQHHPDLEARRLTKTILRRFRLVALTHRLLRAAFACPLPDFEDAVQFESAQSVKADYLVTRNTSHFTLPGVPSITPENFLLLVK